MRHGPRVYFRLRPLYMGMKLRSPRASEQCDPMPVLETRPQTNVISKEKEVYHCHI
jgi:hypothetical protein